MAKLTFSRLQKAHESLKPSSEAVTNAGEDVVVAIPVTSAATTPSKKRKLKEETPAKPNNEHSVESEIPSDATITNAYSIAPAKKRGRPAAKKSPSTKAIKATSNDKAGGKIKNGKQRKEPHWYIDW